MVPAGDLTEKVINELQGLLDEGDIIIDGGNSKYQDSVRRAEKAHQKGIHFLMSEPAVEWKEHEMEPA